MFNRNSKKLTIFHLQATRFAYYEYVDLTEKDFDTVFKTYQGYLCREQAKSGHKAYTILFSKNGISTIIKKRKNYLLLFYLVGLQFPSIFRKMYREPLTIRTILQIIKLKPDIVNILSIFTYFLFHLLLIPILRLKKIKIISFIRGLEPIFSFLRSKKQVLFIQKVFSILIHVVQLILCKCYNSIICQNRRVKYLLQKYNLAPKNKIYLVPNGIDFKIFTHMDKRACQEKLNLVSDYKYLLMINRIYFGQKDIVTVLESLRDFLFKNKKTRIIIISDGPDLQKMERFIQKGKLSDIIIHYRFINSNEIPLFYNASVCLILHSKYEGMPKVIMEAFACKTPVIASDVIGNNLLVKHNKTGLMVEFQNKKQILDVVKLILSDEKLKNKLTKNAFKFIQKFSWSNISQYFLKLYDDLYKKL
ncbi:MAG: glycosyltransferase family 4 protein [Candidatus Helarchaeota archaeon]